MQSNCVAVVPLETELGRKRAIDQSSCNKDYSCAKGFCPSFVGVVGGRLRKRQGALAGPGAARFQSLVAALPVPAAHDWTGPYDLLVTGVGGTGVVTVGAVIAMAAHLEGHSASVLDFMGFAQKGGSVLSFVRLAKDKAALNQVRIDAQQADAVLACDVVVAASADALQTVRHGRTRVLANRHEIPVAESLSNPDASLQVEGLLAKLEFAAGADRVETMDAQQLAHDFLGDSIVSNVLAMGYAWQRGLVPVGLAAMLRALELNGVAVESNKAAFSLGRLAAADPAARARAAARARSGEPARRDARRADRAFGAVPCRVPERGLRRPLSPRRAVGARARAGGRRRRRGPAAQPRRRRPAAEAHGLQGRVRGRASLHRRRVREGAGRAVRGRRPEPRVLHGAARAS